MINLKPLVLCLYNLVHKFVGVCTFVRVVTGLIGEIEIPGAPHLEGAVKDIVFASTSAAQCS